MDSTKKVLVTGHPGQLSTALQKIAGEDTGWIFATRADLDITDRQAVRAALDDHSICTVVNTAAYTAVDAAEADAAAAGLVNGEAPGLIAEACRETETRMVHVSTDFVFDGTACSPILPETPVSPISEYGRTKAAGENRVRDTLGSNALIVRTAWLYSTGTTNFVATMLRLMSNRDRINVVDDQLGTPTSSHTLGRAICDLIACDTTGTHHVTDSGVASWYDFAVAIHEIALEIGLLSKAVRIDPISTSEFPTAAARPSYSVLDKTSTDAALGRHAPHWRTTRRECLESVETSRSRRANTEGCN